MNEQTIITIEIDKSVRGWHCHSVVKYPDWPNPVSTHDGRLTLASTLWHEVLHYLDMPDSRLVSVVVKGKDMPMAEVYRRIEKALAGGVLAYNLPRIRQYLLTSEIAGGSSIAG